MGSPLFLSDLLTGHEPWRPWSAAFMRQKRKLADFGGILHANMVFHVSAA
jgi:hypothetical protein